MRILYLTYLLFFALNCYGQIVPDLTTGDNFLPGYSEQQKRDLIVNTFREKKDGKVPQTSQELYPNLYKYTNTDYMAPIRGTSADPANAFTDYSKKEHFKTNTPQPLGSAPSISPSMYNNQLSIQERNMRQYEADFAAYEAQQKYKEQVLNEANKEFGPEIVYNLGTHTGSDAGRFISAYNELSGMLAGNQEVDFLRAVWLVESSLDTSLSWEEFNSMFSQGVQVISQLMIQDKLPPDDDLSKIMSIFKYMADTTRVNIPGKETTTVSKPMLYDYDDFGGKQDLTKVFVSKLMRTGSGQCMSLPMLFYLYAKAFRADVHMAFAPQHTYVTFQDKIGNWQNIELTGRMFITDDFHWQSGFVSTEQVKSGIYLRPTSEQETLAYLLTTLALTYVKTLGTDDFILQMANTAKRYAPKNLTGHMLYAGYYKDLYNNVLRQYDIYRLSEDSFTKDEKAKTIKQQALSAVQYVKKDLGYREIPDWAYKKWLDGVNELAKQKQHTVRRRQLEQQIKK